MLRGLGEAVSRLPAKQREAVLLAGVEGLSYEEAAFRMGLSIGAVRCHLARARERLRDAVLDQEETPPCAVRPTSRGLRPGGDAHGRLVGA
jgi:RNA polymerase sigma-70 factor (ECF subfamily)